MYVTFSVLTVNIETQPYSLLDYVGLESVLESNLSTQCCTPIHFGVKIYRTNRELYFYLKTRFKGTTNFVVHILCVESTNILILLIIYTILLQGRNEETGVNYVIALKPKIYLLLGPTLCCTEHNNYV